MGFTLKDLIPNFLEAFGWVETFGRFKKEGTEFLETTFKGSYLVKKI